MDVRIGSYGIVIRDGAVLLSHWNDGENSGWTLPGGGVEDFELVPDAAVREIREETGFDVVLGGVLGVDSFFISGKERADGSGRPLHAMRVIYSAEITGGVLTNEMNGSTDEARWVGLDDIDALDRVSLVDVGLAMWRERP